LDQLGWRMVITGKEVQFRVYDLVDSQAICVERGRIRIAGAELCQSRRECGAVRNRICVQKGAHGGWSLLTRRSVRHYGLLEGRLAQPQPLVGEEKESLVFNHGSASYTAKVIQPLFRFRQAVVVHEPVRGIQRAVSEILRERAMKCIGPGARDDRDLSAGSAAKLRSE